MQAIQPYRQTLPTFYAIVTKHNGSVLAVECEGLEHAEAWVEGAVGPKSEDYMGWKGIVTDDKCKTVGTYTWGVVKANRGWRR